MSQYDVCIVGGAGRIGLPLTIFFAQINLSVCISDINEKRIDMIKNKQVPFVENGIEELLNCSKFDCFVDKIPKANYTIICLGSASNYCDISGSSILEFIINNKKQLENNNTKLIIRGTLNLVDFNIIKDSIDLNIAYCPERLSEGNAIYELRTIPQIVGCDSSEYANELVKLFSMIIPDVIKVSIKEAIFIKLMCNAYRYINFSIANELYIVAKNYFGIDFEKVRKNAMFNYPRMKNFPKPGFTSGFCLPKDTSFLPLRLGEAAYRVSHHDIVNAICSMVGDINNKNVGILGVSSKANVDDIRMSLPLKIRDACEILGAKVYMYDSMFKKYSSCENFHGVMNSDILVIGTPHNDFIIDNKNLLTISRANKIIDIWNIFERKDDRIV